MSGIRILVQMTGDATPYGVRGRANNISPKRNRHVTNTYRLLDLDGFSEENFIGDSTVMNLRVS
jgi:hypothetical protein